jgi:hypothetical protein
MDIKYSTSPDKGSFYKQIWDKQLEEGKTSKDIYDAMMAILKEREDIEVTIDKKYKLEYDLRSSQDILKKARNSNVYSQNLYAALCNNQFFYSDKKWSCSWRCAGGIVADILERGDYIDWYCSGIEADITNGYVPEGEITEEIKLDLIKLGWIVREEYE